MPQFSGQKEVFNSDSLLLANEGEAIVLFATMFSVLGAIFAVVLPGSRD